MSQLLSFDFGDFNDPIKPLVDDDCYMLVVPENNTGAFHKEQAMTVKKFNLNLKSLVVIYKKNYISCDLIIMFKYIMNNPFSSYPDRLIWFR